MVQRSQEPRSFHGHSTQSLDSKSRVTVPARWRFAGLEELLALPDVTHPVLRLMPREVLTTQLERVQSEPGLSEQEKLAIMRLYSARAFPCALDRQGRLSLPAAYVQELGFSGEVMLVGAWKHIEIWNPESWKEYASRADAILAVGAQALGI